MWCCFNISRRAALLFLILIGVISVLFTDEPLLILRDENNWKPLEWEEMGIFRGLHMDLVRGAASLGGLDVEFRSYPWNRALQMLHNGSADGLTYVSFCEERNGYMYFDSRNILSRAGFSVIVLKDSLLEYDGNLDSLHGKSVGIIAGFIYGDKFESHQDKMDIHEFRNYEILFSNLEARRVEAVLSSVDDYTAFELAPGRKERYRILEPYYEVDSVYLVFSRKSVSPEIFEKFSAAMDDFKKTDEYRRLLETYKRNQ